MTWRARAVQAIKLAVVAVALAWLVATGRLDLTALLDMRPGLATAGALLVLMPFLITFYRLSVVLRAVGAPIPLRAVYRIGFIAGFFNTFMPGGLGGDLVKVGYLTRETGDGARATAAVLLDRVLALVSVLSIGGASLLVFWPTLQASSALRGMALLVAASLGGLALGVLVAVPVLSSRRLEVELAPGGRWQASLTGRVPFGGLLLRFVEAARLARSHLGMLGAMVLLSVVSQGCSIAAMCLFSWALDLPPTPGQIIAAAPLAMLANTLPVPGGGLGVGEAAMASLLELFAREGAPATGGALIFLMWRLWVVIWGLLGLPPYLARAQEIRSLRRSG